MFSRSVFRKRFRIEVEIYLVAMKRSFIRTSLSFLSFLSVLLSTLYLMVYSNVNYVSFSSVLPLFDIDPEPFTAQWHRVTAISYLCAFNFSQGKAIPGLNIMNF